MTRGAPGTARDIGARYEDIALAHLQASGLRLLERNFSCRFGEIDLVMQAARTIVFVEVRYRRGASAGVQGFGDGVDSVSAAKRGKLARAASFYLAANPRLAHHACRFDVVAIADGEHGPATDWRANAFDAV